MLDDGGGDAIALLKHMLLRGSKVILYGVSWYWWDYFEEKVVQSWWRVKRAKSLKTTIAGSMWGRQDRGRK